MTYAKGPWKVGHNLRNNAADTIAIYGPIQLQNRIGWHNFIADCGAYTETNKANAQLIAAAPELLEALKRARDLIADVEIIEGSPISLLKELTNVINKAEGKV